MANTSENSPDLNEHSIELQARNNSSTLSVVFQLASSTDSVLSDETHRCPLPLRRHAIAFYIVVAFLWGMLLIPSIMFLVPIDRQVDTVSADNNTFIDTFSSNNTLICREDFFELEDQNKCVPNCGSFKGQSQFLTTFAQVFGIAASCFGIINSILFLTVSCIRWKNVFSFPSVFVVYLNLSLLVFITFFLVAYFDQEGLFCSSSNLLETLKRSSSFCIVMGVTLTYVPLQAGLLWLFHIYFSWWKIRFPFHFRECETYHKCIHVTCVLIALVVPAIPVIVKLAIGARDDNIANAAQAADIMTLGSANTSSGQHTTVFKRYGYIIAQFPPRICSPFRSDIVVYIDTILISMLFLLGTPFLVMMFWLIYKHQSQQMKKKKSNKKRRIQTTRKLLIVFSYYVMFGLIADLFISLSAASAMQLAEELKSYFQCESNGQIPDELCDRSRFEKLMTPIFTLNIITQFLLGFFPLVSLVYVLDTKDIKKQLASYSSFGVARWMPSVPSETNSQQAQQRD